ncbi:E3 ubiquitin-protein ligase MARCHF2-like [Dermacentor albipictus]|uniref:E3 ubiquitin-protein ligase MARCHF2-like n=1 Tax=Dermacentor albipictus TaxID=60249 RepID=UPI0031FC3CBD
MAEGGQPAETDAPLQSTPIIGRQRSGRQPARSCSDSFWASPVFRVQVRNTCCAPAHDDEEDAVPLSPILAANVTTSSGPICRICHEGDHGLPLLSICLCSGTMGLVHLLCLEHWLSASGNDSCEICHYRFNVERRPRGFCEWVHSASVRRGFFGDLLCFGLLSPLAFLCGVLCLHGAAQQVLQRRLWESIGLASLAFMLFTVYSAWTVLTFRYHYRGWRKWRVANPYVKVIDTPRDPHFVLEPEYKRPQDRGRNTIVPVALVLPQTSTGSSASASGLDSSFEICSPNTVASGSTAWEYRTTRL